MGDSDIDSNSGLDSISPEPIQDADKLSRKEILSLTAPKATHHSEMLHRETLYKAIGRLEVTVQRLDDECCRLRRVEVEHARFVTSNRYLRLSTLLMSGFAIIGGGLVSQYATSEDVNSKPLLGCGWTLIVAGLIANFFFGVFDPKAGDQNEPATPD